MEVVATDSADGEAEYEAALLAQPEHLPLALRQKNAALSLRLKPLAQCAYSCHSSIAGFYDRMNAMSLDYGAPVEMNPDFQRGHVWSIDQKKAFVKAVLRGAVPESGFVIQFNCANFENFDYEGDLPRGMQCIDGLQRVTALTEFCENKFDVDGLYSSDLEGSSFQISRGRFHLVMQIYAFESKRELLEHYLAINGGGTPHSDDELERVREMMDQCI